MTNLDSIFKESARRAAHSIPDAEGNAPLQRANRSIARRRAIRATGTASLTVAIVGGLAVGAWALSQNGPVEPGPRPSGSASPVPSMTDDSVSASPLPTSDSFPTEEELLLETMPTPDGIVERAKSGWVLAVYRPYKPVFDEEFDLLSREAFTQVLYLIEPDGTRYELMRFDPSLSVELLRWQAGDTTALVRVGPQALITWNRSPDEQTELRVLDLETGAYGTAPADVPTNAMRFVGEMGGGFDVWEIETSEGIDLVSVDRNGDTQTLASFQIEATFSPISVIADKLVIPDPTATIIALAEDGAYTLIDVADGSSTRFEITPPDDGGVCRVVGWWTADDLLTECLTADQLASVSDDDQYGQWDNVPDLYIATAGSPSIPLVFLRDVADDEPYSGDYRTASWVGDGEAVILSRPYHNIRTPGGAWFFDGDDYTSIPDWETSHSIAKVVNGSVYVASTGGLQEYAPWSLVRFDPDTRETTTLIPYPPFFDSIWGTIFLESWTVGE